MIPVFSRHIIGKGQDQGHRNCEKHIIIDNSGTSNWCQNIPKTKVTRVVFDILDKD